LKWLKVIHVADLEEPFLLKFEAIATSMTSQKVENAVATKADYLISTDLSCLMHIDSYIQKHQMPIKVMHIADVLASV